jgi:peptide/nickel transport system substrate-binding protein
MARFVLSLVGMLTVVLPVVGSPAVGTAEKPRYGGTYIRNIIYAGPLSMDPIFAFGASTIMIQMNIFDGLVRVDPDRGTVVPDIAERWTHSPDGKTFTFYLRKGVLYHDGSEVTADDFKFQFERTANPDNLSPLMVRLTGVAGLKPFQEKRASEISGIRVVDRYTLQITMERPNILLPFHLTGVWASAVPRRAVERLGKEFGTNPVGSGPFIFERWVRGQEIVMKRNPNYWRTDRWGNRLPYVDRVVHRLIQDMTAVEAEIDAGRIDSAYIRDSAYLKYKNHPVFGKHLIEGEEMNTAHIGFNLEMKESPWHDKRVRQAVNHAIDRKTMIEVVQHGKAYLATGVIPRTMPGHDPTLNGYVYDPDRARRLLAEAGYQNGFAAKIVGSATGTVGPPIVEAVMGYLNAVGIRPQYEMQDSTAVRVRGAKGQFEWYAFTSGAEGQAVLHLQRAFHSRYIGPAGNWTRYHNPQVDDLLDRAAEARDTTTMTRLVRQAERIIVDDAPWLTLFYLKGVLVQQPYVRGLRAAPMDSDFQPLEEVWLAVTPRRR